MKKLLTFLMMLLITSQLFSQNVWTQKSDFPGGKRDGAFSLVIGDKAYVGLGSNGVHSFSDWWEYTPSTDSWTQKAHFPGTPRYVGGALSIGGKGYIGLGSSDDFEKLQDWWEYDPAADSWTKKQSFPAPGRFGVATFTIGNNGYICFGDKGSANGPNSNQLWEYNPVADGWTQKAPFPGHARYAGYAFSIGDKGYAGLGGRKTTLNDVYRFYQDFYEYDPSLNAWTQKADFPDRRSYPIGFVLNNMGYVGSGNSNNGIKDTKFYAYDPIADTWSYQTTMPADGRAVGTGFAVNGKGYAGLGDNFITGIFYKDIWEYSPAIRMASESSSTGNCAATFIVSDHTLIPQLQEGVTDVQFRMLDVSGKLITEEKLNNNSPIYLNSNLPAGIYFITISANDQSCLQKIMIR